MLTVTQCNLGIVSLFFLNPVPVPRMMMSCPTGRSANTAKSEMARPRVGPAAPTKTERRAGQDRLSFEVRARGPKAFKRPTMSI